LTRHLSCKGGRTASGIAAVFRPSCRSCVQSSPKAGAACIQTREAEIRQTPTALSKPLRRTLARTRQAGTQRRAITGRDKAKRLRLMGLLFSSGLFRRSQQFLRLLCACLLCRSQQFGRLRFGNCALVSSFAVVMPIPACRQDGGIGLCARHRAGRQSRTSRFVRVVIAYMDRDEKRTGDCGENRRGKKKRRARR
jgi:hypothetical protein